MGSNTNELFKLAAKYFYIEYKIKGGSQKEIAEKLGITNSYVSSVLNGSRSASLPLMEQIATQLSNRPLDEFLVVGRRIKNGQEPLQKAISESEDTPESLIAKLTYYVVSHQRIENELNEKQWLLQQALNVANYGIVIVDNDRKVLAYNKAYKAMFSYPEEILSTRNIIDYINWSRLLFLDQVEFDKNAKEALASTTAIAHTSKLKDGRTIERKTFPIHKNESFAGWVVHLIDITLTKRKGDRKK